jgi:anti-repressor protein
MNELIKVIETKHGNQAVSSRELHEFLEVETPYRLWFPRMCEYGFIENEDYTPNKFVHPQNGQETTDFIMKLDMAKEISMLTRNEKGKKARQYFIQCERNWNSPEMIMLRALKIADQRYLEYKERNKQLETVIENQKPKVLFADAVECSVDSILIRDLAKIVKQNGVDMGEKRLFQWMRDNGYILTTTNKPSQKSMDLGVLEIKEGLRLGSEQKFKPTFTTKVSGKGQIYFVKKLIEENNLLTIPK